MKMLACFVAAALSLEGALRADLPPILPRPQNQAETNALFNQWLAETERLFPAMKDPDSQLAKRARQIQEEARSVGLPFYVEPESALLIAFVAACQLNVEPIDLAQFERARSRAFEGLSIGLSEQLAACRAELAKANSVIDQLNQRLATGSAAYQQLYANYAAAMQRLNAAPAVPMYQGPASISPSDSALRELHQINDNLQNLEIQQRINQTMRDFDRMGR